MPHSYGASFSGDGFFGPRKVVNTITNRPKRTASVTRIKMGSVPIGWDPSFLLIHTFTCTRYLQLPGVITPPPVVETPIPYGCGRKQRLPAGRPFRRPLGGSGFDKTLKPPPVSRVMWASPKVS